MSRADTITQKEKKPTGGGVSGGRHHFTDCIIAICVPLIVPKTMGYQLYTVVSGSMEPAVPTGSLVYIKYVEPGDIETGDIIAFYGSDAQDPSSHIAWYLTVMRWESLLQKAMPTRKMI